MTWDTTWHGRAGRCGTGRDRTWPACLQLQFYHFKSLPATDGKPRLHCLWEAVMWHVATLLVFRAAGVAAGSAPRHGWAVCELWSSADTTDPWDGVHDENEPAHTRDSASALPKKECYQESGRWTQGENRPALQHALLLLLLHLLFPYQWDDRRPSSLTLLLSIAIVF